MKIKFSLLFWILILFACSPASATPQIFPPTSDTTLPPSSPPKIIITVGTPNIGQPPDGNFPDTPPTSDTCAFIWAHPLLEELTILFEAEIKKVEPQATAHASSFGEDCVYADGRRVFFGIETDFYLDLPVANLTDFDSFGDWIAQTMPIVESMPPDMLEGSQTGFVEYKFAVNATEFLTVRVPIQQYRDIADGKTGEELFRLFYTEP
ncbi:MAG TPA: hypothetical protein DCX53_14320 [Anaerolineae bacterium]|nr:hypothetical protein [Anaerolineae bacterium]